LPATIKKMMTLAAELMSLILIDGHHDLDLDFYPGGHLDPLLL
jgi:hypothetical protein